MTHAKSKLSDQPNQSWLGNPALVRGVSLAEQVYEHLREAIVTGRITPGVTIQEPLISEHFSVSRTPVREALLRLRDDGLIETKRQSGTIVAPVDVQRVEEGMIVRESLEPRLASIAAEKISSRALADLSFETDRMESAAKANDSSAFIAADDQFHRILVDASGFAHIVQVIERVNAQLDRVRYLSVSEPLRAPVALAEHRQLIELLRFGDSAGSAELLQQHLLGSWVLVRELLAKMNTLAKT